MAIQNRIQDLLDEVVRKGHELGVQVAAYHKGALIADAWSGDMDASRRTKISGDTLFPVFSTTKGIAATIIHLLVERGQIAYDTRIAQVWPEFAANGKSEITLRYCLTHMAGLPHVPMTIGPPQIHDWDAVCAALAAAKPAWSPGSRMEYHAMTYGWLLGEVAQRVDGRPFSQMVQEEICAPLNIETLFTGLPAVLDSHVATLEAREFEMPVLDETVPQAVPAFAWPLHEMMNRPEARRACQPASNGIMNARAIARHYAALLPGGVEGVELLPPERIREAIVWHEPPGEAPLHFGLGYLVGGEGSNMGSENSFGHGGYGGSLGFADLETGLAFGFTRNLFSPAPTLEKVLGELRAAL